MEKNEGKNLNHLQAGELDANQLKTSEYIGRMMWDELSQLPCPRDGAMRRNRRKTLLRKLSQVFARTHLNAARLTCPVSPSLRSSVSALPLHR